MWVPNNPVSKRDGIEDSVGRVARCSIKAQDFRAQELGDELKRLRPPLPELTFAGLMIGSGPELKHFFNASRSLRSAAFVGRRLAQHARDMATNGRGMLPTNGNSLAGRLFRSALDLGVKIWTDAPATRLDMRDGGVCGAALQTSKGEIRVQTRRGVVLAAGGFPQDKAHSQQNSRVTSRHLRRGRAAGRSAEWRFRANCPLQCEIGAIGEPISPGNAVPTSGQTAQNRYFEQRPSAATLAADTPNLSIA
jgi:hypothetical protein